MDRLLPAGPVGLVTARLWTIDEALEARAHEARFFLLPQPEQALGERFGDVELWALGHAFEGFERHHRFHRWQHLDADRLRGGGQFRRQALLDDAPERRAPRLCEPHAEPPRVE